MACGQTDWAAAREVLGAQTLSVVLPVYHLPDAVEENLDRVVACFGQAGFAYELVPVDDGSGDGTAEALRRAAAKHPALVKPVWIEKNAGKGNALKEGFRASTGAFVLLLDGDLDIAPAMLPGFFASMRRHGSDIVVGSKRHPDSKVQYPWHRRLASAVYFGLVHLFIGLPVTDTQTGMKLFRRRVLGEALDRMLVKTYAFDLELLSIAHGRGAKVSEAPVEIRFGQKFGALKFRTVRDMVHDTLSVFYRLRILRYYAKVEVPPPLAAKPFVSVVIACPADSWMLQECLRALADQTYRDFEVLVLPDGGPVEKPEGKAIALTVLPTGKVRPAEKRNRGIARATGQVVAFIDDDAYPDAHWIENAVKYFADPEIGGVGGPGVTPPGDGILARAGGRVYENFLVSGTYRYRYVGGRVRRDVDDYPSCNLFVRADLLRKFGGYRTDFWPGEDTLLCRSIVCDGGKRIVYDPWTVVYHHRRRLFGPHLRQLGRYGFHRGYFVKRFPENSFHAAYFVPSAFALYAALLALAGASAPLWAGAQDAVMPWLWLFAAPMALYLLLTGLGTLSSNPVLWLLTWAGVVASHVWYGVRFLAGLCASRAPCEYIGRDHARGAGRPVGAAGET
ncbi:MAG: glycosyltransferase [Kiritimatiellia bacterium]